MIYRHGDLSLHPVEKIEGEPVNHNGSFVLAEGETTGHKHVITVPNIEDMEIYRTVDGGMIMRVKQEATISHEEHKTIKLPVGDYKLFNEREYDWFSLKVQRVID